MKKFIAKCMSSDTKKDNLALLFLRVFVGAMMLTHGWAKLMNFDALSAVFPDPIGLGATFSLILIICAEVGCSLLLILGLFTRFATIPLIFGMGVAVLMTHASDPFQVKELALFYVGVYIFLMITGGGRFSIDNLISKKLRA